MRAFQDIKGTDYMKFVFELHIVSSVSPVVLIDKILYVIIASE